MINKDSGFFILKSRDIFGEFLMRNFALCLKPIVFFINSIDKGNMTVQTGKWLDRKLHRNYTWIKKVNL